MLITAPIAGASATNTISFEADFGQTPVARVVEFVRREFLLVLRA